MIVFSQQETVLGIPVDRYIPYKGTLVPLLTEAVGVNPRMTGIRAAASLNESSNLCAMFASKLSAYGGLSPG
jgi:hypothetical protein